MEMRCERQDAEAPNVVKTLDSNAEMNKEKECDGNPKFVSSTTMQDISSGMGSLYEVDKVSSQSDGLEDLWKDMSLAMEYSKVIMLLFSISFVAYSFTSSFVFVVYFAISMLHR